MAARWAALRPARWPRLKPSPLLPAPAPPSATTFPPAPRRPWDRSTSADSRSLPQPGSPAAIPRCPLAPSRAGPLWRPARCRRLERLERAATEAGPDSVAIECDICDETSVRSAIDATAEALGGIDNLVYTPAVGPLVPLVDTDADTWRRVFDTNVIGAALATAAAVPHLTASEGKVVYLSSDAGTYGPPWPGLGAYGVSKSALERLIESWRAEHPDIGFTCLVVGECGGGKGDAATGMTTGWDMDLAAKSFPLWVSRGCLPATVMPVEDLIDVVHTIMSTNSATSMPMVIARGAPGGAAATVLGT